ncbi:MAG: ankyrin repeat domain-containing protein [Gemmatimonadales bacterium]|nr:ankyrin repeat domain-containing protein [Gemmatimonadales bacterium]
MLKLLFWALVALDVLGVLFFFVLGLAAAGSAKTSPLLVALNLLVFPAALLAVAIVVFVRTSSPGWRALAFLLAAAPVTILVVTQLSSTLQLRANSNAAGELTFFRSGPMRDLVEAIRRHDVATVASLAPTVDINARGMDGMTLLVLALREMRKTPEQHDILAALLAAKADPNLGTEYEVPLEMALQVADRGGLEPVRLLLAAGADPNRNGASGRPSYFSAIGRGASLDALRLLLDHGADLKAVGAQGETALLQAATAPNWAAALHLLERGADWRVGRTFKGATFTDVVEAHVAEMKHRASFDGTAVTDDGVAAVVAFLQRQ